MRPSPSLPAWFIALAASLLGILSMVPASAVAASGQTNSPTASLDNAKCLSCHDGKKSQPELPGAGGETRPLHAVSPDKYGKSVHSTMQCVACHQDITDAATPHKKDSAQKPDCVQCHTALWETARKENVTRQKERLGVVVQNIEAYKKSFHSRPNKEDKSHVNATCEDCHDTHSFAVPPRGTTRRAEWHQTVPNVCGDKCHTDELKQYKGSVHGQAIIKDHNINSAVCTDCHSSHAIGDTSDDPTRIALTAQCGSCHEESRKTYLSTYHGQVNTLGSATTAKCFDCHGSHGIFKADHPKSKVNPKNLLKTCRQCHSDKQPGMHEATAGFASFGPHANSHDFEKYPQMWLTSKFMIALLIGVFTFFWLHSGLWFYREYKERHDHKEHRKAVRASELHLEKGKHFRRFAWPWRLAHLFFALSVMTLVLTGMTVFYAETSWAKTVVMALGGPKMSGLIHRIAAFTMLGIFFVHLVYVTISLIRNRKTFEWFGPTSLVPRWKDLWDMIGMFKWGFGLGPRPSFDRWTYWEKFDYWAVFWGMAIIGGSGMMLAFPHVVASVLPGWVFNVAMVVHGEEAFLAAVFLFTVHFFNNHLRPVKYPPPDIVMFTGTVSLEEFKHEHWDEYSRLLKSGELEKYLVDAPSAPFTLGSKILGLTLIAFGLALLVMIAIGFFGGS